jgi:hypothetical protein
MEERLPGCSVPIPLLVWLKDGLLGPALWPQHRRRTVSFHLRKARQSNSETAHG